MVMCPDLIFQINRNVFHQLLMKILKKNTSISFEVYLIIDRREENHASQLDQHGLDVVRNDSNSEHGVLGTFSETHQDGHQKTENDMTEFSDDEDRNMLTTKKKEMIIENQNWNYDQQQIQPDLQTFNNMIDQRQQDLRLRLKMEDELNNIFNELKLKLQQNDDALGSHGFSMLDLQHQLNNLRTEITAKINNYKSILN